MQYQWVVVLSLGGVAVLIALLGSITAISVARRGQRQIREVISSSHRQAVLLAREADRVEAYRTALEFSNGIRLEFAKVTHGEFERFTPPDIGTAAALLATIATHGGPTASHLYSEFLMQVPTVNHYAGRLARAPRDEERHHGWVLSVRELEDRHDAFAAHAHVDLSEPLDLPAADGRHLGRTGAHSAE
jgi:hypothetical protein